MTTYFPATKRQRTNNFDMFVESGVAILDNPVIADQIDGYVHFAASKKILQEAVLPNLRCGILSVPKEYRSDDTTLILPVKKSTSRLAHFALETNVIWQGAEFGEVPARTQYSRTYAHDFSHDPFVDDTTKAQKLPTGVTRLAGTGGLTYVYDNTWRSRSRPWITVSKELFLQPPDSIGEVAVHETIHVQDFLAEAYTLQSLRLYSAASELRAYKAAAEIQKILGTETAYVQELEAKRQQEIDDNSFIPTEALYRWMADGGYTANRA